MFKKIKEFFSGVINKLRGTRNQQPRRNQPPRRRVNSNGSDIGTVRPSHESYGSLITSPEKRARRKKPKHLRKSSSFTSTHSVETNKGKVKIDSSSTLSRKSNRKQSFSM